MRAVDSGLIDVGQRAAKGPEGRALGRSEEALQRVDHLYLFGMIRALVAAGNDERPRAAWWGH